MTNAPTPTRFARIAGTGSALPPRRLTNADLVAELATQGIESSDDWIVERTGIRARHFAAADVTASELALYACRRALEAAGRQAEPVFAEAAAQRAQRVEPGPGAQRVQQQAQIGAGARNPAAPVGRSIVHAGYDAP